MSKGSHKLRIPNDHGSDISAPLIREILRQAHIDSKEWDAPFEIPVAPIIFDASESSGGKYGCAVAYFPLKLECRQIV
jgi:hypothetical protein